MRFHYGIPLLAALIAGFTGHQAQSVVRPVADGDLARIRGGQAPPVCLTDGFSFCPTAGSGTCRSAEGKVQPDSTLKCPYDQQKISIGTYSVAIVATDPNVPGDMGSTGGGKYCTTITPCGGTCSGKKGSTG